MKKQKNYILNPQLGHNSQPALIWVSRFRRVQEIDGSYFESFTALAWKQENQRQSVLKTTEVSAANAPPKESDLGILAIDYTPPPNERDKLYVEMLYTIANTVRYVTFSDLTQPSAFMAKYGVFYPISKEKCLKMYHIFLLLTLFPLFSDYLLFSLFKVLFS